MFCFGISTILFPSGKFKGFYHDFTSIRWPFGGTVAVLGLCFIYIFFSKNTKQFYKQQKIDKQVWICPNCEIHVLQKDKTGGECEKCGGTLIRFSDYLEAKDKK